MKYLKRINSWISNMIKRWLNVDNEFESIKFSIEKHFSEIDKTINDLSNSISNDTIVHQHIVKRVDPKDLSEDSLSIIEIKHDLLIERDELSGKMRKMYGGRLYATREVNESLTKSQKILGCYYERKMTRLTGMIDMINIVTGCKVNYVVPERIDRKIKELEEENLKGGY